MIWSGFLYKKAEPFQIIITWSGFRQLTTISSDNLDLSSETLSLFLETLTLINQLLRPGVSP